MTEDELYGILDERLESGELISIRFRKGKIRGRRVP